MGGVVVAGAVGAALASAIATATDRTRIARLAGAACAVLFTAATVRLGVAIWQLDFSFEYVAGQSRARSGGGYRMAALWAGAEGSLLLFTTLLSLVTGLLLVTARVRRVGAVVSSLVLVVLGLTTLAFANPFGRAALPAVRGAGLTPILEHPAMLYHPPILYLGLVTTLIPFALFIDAAEPFQVDKRARLRRWMIVSWSLLTVGLATGANWAYVELGWGGYWAWDPVENTVLMPWLALTAAIHLIGSDRLRARHPRWVAAAVLAPFPLVAFGTAVTRSGGLSSVHAFADAQALGWALGLLAAAILAVGGFFVVRAPAAAATDLTFDRREWLLIMCAVLAGFSMLYVFVGVGVPLLPSFNRVVTAEFYNRIGTPVLVLALGTLAALPVLLGSRARRGTIVSAITLALALVAMTMLGVSDWFSLVVLTLGAAAVVGHVASNVPVMMATIVGHIGFVVLALGIAGGAQSSVVTTVLAPGETESFGNDLVFTYESFVVTDGPRPGSEAVTVRSTVSEQQQEPIVLSPGLVTYPDRAVVLAETALKSTPRRDVQVVVRTITDDGIAAFELSERPAQMLVWWGSALIALAGPLALPRRAR